MKNTNYAFNDYLEKKIGYREKTFFPRTVIILLGLRWLSKWNSSKYVWLRNTDLYKPYFAIKFQLKDICSHKRISKNKTTEFYYSPLSVQILFQNDKNKNFNPQLPSPAIRCDIELNLSLDHYTGHRGR